MSVCGSFGRCVWQGVAVHQTVTRGESSEGPSSVGLAAIMSSETAAMGLSHLDQLPLGRARLRKTGMDTGGPEQARLREGEAGRLNDTKTEGRTDAVSPSQVDVTKDHQHDRKDAGSNVACKEQRPGTGIGKACGLSHMELLKRGMANLRPRAPVTAAE
jgi:hypothetical protein